MNEQILKDLMGQAIIAQLQGELKKQGIDIEVTTPGETPEQPTTTENDGLVTFEYAGFAVTTHIDNVPQLVLVALSVMAAIVEAISEIEGEQA